MSVRRTSTSFFSRANFSATARDISGIIRHSTVGSLAVCMNITVRASAPAFSRVSRKVR
jgi:hypothetical protein